MSVLGSTRKSYSPEQKKDFLRVIMAHKKMHGCGISKSVATMAKRKRIARTNFYNWMKQFPNTINYNKRTNGKASVKQLSILNGEERVANKTHVIVDQANSNMLVSLSTITGVPVDNIVNSILEQQLASLTM